ncbi:Rpn family recombination-promoting nuclease/putative transposase [Flammeovirga sp. EKP202]|uniref:Rpn family recombination-promoting nuclease/putative transposase n=1 Tax=Flammeovirga sp. EKP202 TaxID=2770592 RepID=UPI00165F604B|nr:Rpn family recombination-promoting nuclease/putative transposase [Flammeovirga sp. EKP202]MBD0402842.1 Rpn family recombination-promoting nuclease/putative transposase [Flammeovirga sp. EKP202]
MCTSRYINPFTDFGFKKIFGEEANKDILIDFLNSVLPAEDQIYDLTYKSTEHLPKNDTDRKAIYDLYCENEKGEKFIVELQRAEQTHFKDRTIYYSSFPIQEQDCEVEDNILSNDYQMTKIAFYDGHWY